MIIEISEEELKIIKSALNFAIYWIENKESLRKLNNTLSFLEKELERGDNEISNIQYS